MQIPDLTPADGPPPALRRAGWKIGFRLLLVCAVGFAGASGLAAELKHDLYLAANLSGPSQVIGSRKQLPSGIYRSTDRVAIEHVGFNHIRLFALTADIQDSTTLFLAALDGVVRAADRGRSWRILTGSDVTEPKSIAFDPNEPTHVYVGLPDGILVSHDRGQSWERMQQGLRRPFAQTIAVDRTRAGRVLAGTEKGVYLTGNGARTWTLVQPTVKTVNDVRQSPHDPRTFFMVSTADGAFTSRDGGRTWKNVPGISKEHTLYNCSFDPRDARRIVVGGWGAGVVVSENQGRTWSDRTAGLPSREIWRVAIDPDLPNRIYAAPHEAPVHVSDDFGRSWRPLFFEQAIVYDLIFVPRS